MQLAPGAAVGMTVGTDMAQPHPAPIGTGRMGTEVRRRVHLARPSPRGHDAGGRATGRLRSVLVGLRTGGTGGLAGEARKRLRVAGALARWQDGLHWSPLCRSALARPGSRQHEKYPEQSQQHELREKKVWNHGKVPSLGGETRGFYLILGPRELSAAYRYIYGPTRAVKEVSSEKNTLRDRCSHISGLLVKTSYGLRALMKSALPLLITTAASRALYLIRVKGSRSDLSCHQLDSTSHRAAGLLHVLLKQNSH